MFTTDGLTAATALVTAREYASNRGPSLAEELAIAGPRGDSSFHPSIAAWFRNSGTARRVRRFPISSESMLHRCGSIDFGFRPPPRAAQRKLVGLQVWRSLGHLRLTAWAGRTFEDEARPIPVPGEFLAVWPGASRAFPHGSEFEDGCWSARGARLWLQPQAHFRSFPGHRHAWRNF